MISIVLLSLFSLSGLCLSSKQIFRRKDLLQSFKSDRIFLSHVKYFDEVRALLTCCVLHLLNNIYHLYH